MLRNKVFEKFGICIIVSQIDRYWNEEVHRRAGIVGGLVDRVNQRALRWFKRMERLD